MPQELIIGDHNWQQHLQPPPGQGMGLVPRDYSRFPRGHYAGVAAVDVPLIDKGEYSSRIADKVANASQISDVMLARSVPCLDQDGKGYCWAHSSTGCVMAARALMNEPTVELSAYAVACVIKSYRDEGGWGAESADWIAANGVPSSQFWPQRSMDRSNDNAAMRANAALHKITGQWADLSAGQYDRNLTFDQVVTLLLSGEPVVGDFNWWSHSVMLADAVDGASQRQTTRSASTGKLTNLQEFEAAWGVNDPVTAGIGIRFRNSWGDSYGNKGFSVLTGSKAVPDGAVGIRSVLPSPT
jgi:hypothetical protein